MNLVSGLERTPCKQLTNYRANGKLKQCALKGAKDRDDLLSAKPSIGMVSLKEQLLGIAITHKLQSQR